MLELFLVADAETLLFVDDDEAELWQLYVVRQVSGACRSEHRPRPFPADSTTDFCSLLDRKRESSSTLTGNAANRFLKRLKMLIRKDRRRRQDGRLFAVHHGLERRTHRDLGLAVADIADDQPVHRRRRFHVGL